MAPEQALGRGHVVTPAADVYGLGCILYELLTGHSPFRGATVTDTLRLVIESEPPRPSSLNREVDGRLEAICLKCLEKRPEERYPSAQALAEELAHYRDAPVSHPARSLGARLGGWLRRRLRGPGSFSA
jgi:serine/threonine-protein kinase